MGAGFCKETKVFTENCFLHWLNRPHPASLVPLYYGDESEGGSAMKEERRKRRGRRISSCPQTGFPRHCMRRHTLVFSDCSVPPVSVVPTCLLNQAHKNIVHTCPPSVIFEKRTVSFFSNLSIYLSIYLVSAHIY